MKFENANAKPAYGRLLVAYGCAALLPCLALRLNLEPGTATLGWSHAPFAWYGMALVQSLALLPLTLMVASSLAHRSPLAWRERPPRWPVFVGLALFALSFLAAEPGKALAKPSVTLPYRLAVQLGLAAILQLPWCYWAVLGRPAAFGTRPAKFTMGRPGLGGGILACTIAVVLPWCHAAALIEAETRRAGDLLKKNQPVRAWPAVVGLSELGSTEPIVGGTPWQVRQHLERELAKTRAEIAHPLSAQASAQDKVSRARNLAVLDRLDDALTILDALPDHVPALLLAATICQDQGDFARSDVLYRASLKVPSAPAEAQQALTARIEAYDGLVFNARGSGRRTEGEAIYHEAMTALPSARAYFQLQLGRHYHICGRPSDAFHALQTAVSLEPALKGQAAPLLQDIMERTPSCLLRR